MGGAASGRPQRLPSKSPAKRQRWRKAAAGGCTNPAGPGPSWGGVTAGHSCPRWVPPGGQGQGGVTAGRSCPRWVSPGGQGQGGPGTSRAPCPDPGACSSSGVRRCRGSRTPPQRRAQLKGVPAVWPPQPSPAFSPCGCTGQGPMWGRGEGTGHGSPAWADPQGLGGAGGRNGKGGSTWGADPWVPGG